MSWKTPRDSDIGLVKIGAGEITASLLPNGSLFALSHQGPDISLMINQVLGSPVSAGIGRVCVRRGGARPAVINATIPGPGVRFGADRDRIAWEKADDELLVRVTLWFSGPEYIWLWRVEAINRSDHDIACDAILIQDLGLGERGFLMNNEAYASQYIDHHVEQEETCGPVIMSRQNLAQRGSHPWVAHGCLGGAAAFATDALQIFGTEYRDAGSLKYGFGQNLPSERLQHEAACAALQSPAAQLKPGSSTVWTFFGMFMADHPEASGRADLARIASAHEAASRFQLRDLVLALSVASLVENAPPLVVEALREKELDRLYQVRLEEEWIDGALQSFFVPEGALNRHVVLASKDRLVRRRHGAILRSGQSMLPDDTLLCATAWMHGVFAAQLTIGNTSLHKLFSVSRDPYNITRGSGLRILVELDANWHLLTVPTLFEMGLSDCHWIYHLKDRRIAVHAAAAGDETAMQWTVTVEGEPCRFLIFAHLVLGEREFEQSGEVKIDAAHKRLTFRPDADWLWGQRYPEAIYHLATSLPEDVEAIGGDELLFPDSVSRGRGHAVLRTRAVNAFSFAVTGSPTDRAVAERLAAKYETGVETAVLLAPALRFWEGVTCGTRIEGDRPGAPALDLMFPWLVQNGMIHVTVPHGLEQYTGAAWGTRDVCQGPVELFLALAHDEPVKDILRIVFAQQYERRGDWPQWFMLEPYSNIQDPHAHGDVIVWPLKALCDYIEATGDLAFLDEPVAWRSDESFRRTEMKDTVAAHIEKLIATAKGRFIPGTSLMRYGEGDWNDSLQPADPAMRDWMVSSWTVALFFEQLRRYVEVLNRAGREGSELLPLAEAMRKDFNKYLIRGGTVAGYAIFDPKGGEQELLLHPADEKTGLKYSLLPMTGCILARLFTPEQARHHLGLIREHLLFPDGARLMDRPVTYRGGPEVNFRRAESSSFFGREIGLMYVHAHIRYAEALAAMGDAEGLWNALLTINPAGVGKDVANAAPRQRNAYYSSSDARFPDRYQASAEWERARDGTIAVDGGWRIYSSGPGLFVNMLIRHVLGRRRNFGQPLTP